ncbi:MAG: di-trans,poly-cis-decaprenylcistransferase, partial [Chloroflexi bacterium]|nr:di-trans,poly-cis-decaprenylcistransferase [Chloroflexota bacterium]
MTDSKPQLTRIPYHVAIIMDGNGRCAQQRSLPRLAGHRAGTENIRPILECGAEYGVKMMTLYAFSTENWKRPSEEVEGLMGILEMMLKREVKELHKNGVQLRHLGRLEDIPPNLQAQVREAIELTRNNERIILNVAFNYGGRAEILDAVRRLLAEGVAPAAVDEEPALPHVSGRLLSSPPPLPQHSTALATPSKALLSSSARG